MYTKTFTFENLHFIYKELWGALSVVSDSKYAECKEEVNSFHNYTTPSIQILTVQRVLAVYSFPESNWHCPACVYDELVDVEEKSYDGPCYNCPIVRSSYRRCLSPSSNYNKWLLSIREGNFKAARNIAIIIRDMQWRKSKYK